MSETTDATSADTTEEIMRATYRALCEHGYASLTMQDIADESDKSTAALHYHYDTKEALLLSFLDHLYGRFTDKYGDVEGENAVDRLVSFVDGILCQSDLEDPEGFQTALLEMRAQAPYDEAYRDRLSNFEAFVSDRVESIVEEGISEGTIRSDVDPADTAAFVATLIDGVNTRRTTIGDTGGGTRRTFLAYVREHLVAPGTDLRIDDGEDDGSATTGEENTRDESGGGAGA